MGNTISSGNILHTQSKQNKQVNKQKGKHKMENKQKEILQGKAISKIGTKCELSVLQIQIQFVSAIIFFL